MSHSDVIKHCSLGERRLGGLRQGVRLLHSCHGHQRDPEQPPGRNRRDQKARDGENDIEMLQLAGVGCAMANAVDKVKAVADRVLRGTNDEDGVYHADFPSEGHSFEPEDLELDLPFPGAGGRRT